MHNELAYQIKLSLKPSSRSDPEVRIEVPFDVIHGVNASRHQSERKPWARSVQDYILLKPEIILG